MTLPEKFNARTPNNSIPPPNPIIEETKEETKLEKIIKIIAKKETDSGNDEIFENNSLSIKLINSIYLF